MRRFLIQGVLPLLFMIIPFAAATLVFLAIPIDATTFFLDQLLARGEGAHHPAYMDWLILSLGAVLFCVQMMLCWRAFRWRRTGFDTSADRWINHLSQAAEWFPMLGLLGTVGGILQTFASIHGTVQPTEIINKYAPAITATGAGLFMAFINILPPWIMIMGRDLMMTLSGKKPTEEVEDLT